MPEPRRLLVVAARVHTGADAADAGADAVLVNAGRITHVGRAADLRSLAPAVRVVEIPGATLTPGLTDAHIHLTEWALAREYADLSAARSPAEVVEITARHAQRKPSAAWIRGYGWNPHHWGGAYPDRAELDRLLPDRPVVLQSHDMHAVWANGAALDAAGITAATADPADGRIVRDERGRPTGVLLEYAAQLIAAAAPAPEMVDVVAAVEAAQSALHALGITGVHSFPGIHVPLPEPLAVLQALRDTGKLRIRALQHIRLQHLDDALRLGLRSGFGDDMLRVGGVKMFLDGALGSRTAWMREPYENSTDHGMRVLDPAEFADHVRRAAGAGIAVTVHAIGDAAVCLALDTLTRAAHDGLAMPHRIEHVQCCPPERFCDAGRAGIVCSVQPAHLISDWQAADRHWGERARGTYAFRSLAAAGAVLAFGSDAPVEPVDPRLALYAAVTRRDLDGEPAGGWHPAERLDPRAALEAYTRGPAVAAGMGDCLGILAPGMLADIVAWDSDPLDAMRHDAEDASADGYSAATLNLRCKAAIVAGSIVWSDN